MPFATQVPVPEVLTAEATTRQKFRFHMVFQSTFLREGTTGTVPVIQSMMQPMKVMTWLSASLIMKQMMEPTRTPIATSCFHRGAVGASLGASREPVTRGSSKLQVLTSIL